MKVGISKAKLYPYACSDDEDMRMFNWHNFKV